MDLKSVKYDKHVGSSAPPVVASKHGNEFEMNVHSPVSIECSRSTVDPDATNVTPSRRTRAPEPKTRSVRSKSPAANGPVHTASQNQSAATCTPSPCITSSVASRRRQRTSHASGGQ